MGLIYDEFAKEMAALRRRYEGRPDLERRQLYAISLEREQLVAVAYDEEVLRPRLAALRVPDELRTIIGHALSWLWRDEEMHAVFIRGTLLAGEDKLRAPKAMAQQSLGIISGWTSSLKQHVAPANAPLAHGVASTLAGVATTIGKLSPSLRQEMKLRSFRQFCLFNVDAEQTAELCWRRLVDLAETEGDRKVFEHIAADEQNHLEIFQLFANALDDRDQLLPTVSVDEIVEGLRAVGEAYLPRKYRTEFVGPLGSGARVVVNQGESLADKHAVLQQTLEQSGLAELITPGATVAIKASFSLGYDKRDMSMVVDPEVVEQVAQFVRSHGATDVAVIEAPSLYDQFYDGRSVKELAAYFGYEGVYRIVDAGEDQVAHEYPRGLGTNAISATWLSADVRISLPKLRAHCSEGAHLSIANLQGLSGRLEDFLFVEKYAHYPAGTVAVADAAPPSFALIDAYESAADGMFGVMACSTPKQPLRFYAGADALAVDCVAIRDLGVVDPNQSQILRTAFNWFGVDNSPVETIGVTEPIEGWRGPHRNEWSTMLSMAAYPIYVHGSGRGSLFLPQMDEKAFPPKSNNAALRKLRRFTSSALRLHPSK